MLDRIGVIDIVIASHDRRFDYRKLQVAFDALWFHKRARHYHQPGPVLTFARRTRRPSSVPSRHAPAPGAR